MSVDHRLDLKRAERLGFGEAIFCEGKSDAHLAAIMADLLEAGAPHLLTRLAPERLAALPGTLTAALDYDPVSRTGFLGAAAAVRDEGSVAILSGGTSDAAVAREAERTLRFHGVAPFTAYDVGVAGLWRLTGQLEALTERRVIIAVAGMDAALPTVVGGLHPGAIIAVPTSVGYGAARGGETALSALLASCAPGISVVNIDNGYGAACAALRILGPQPRS